MSEQTDSAPEPAEPVRQGTAAASRPGRLIEPAQEELDALPADRRLELLELRLQRRDAERERRRHSRHQWFNSIGILLGALFTASGLFATAVTLQTGQDELRTAKEGQVTDRYTKAVEQLGSPKRDVRLGAIYALERIAADSPRDRTTIHALLAAFVREHGPAATVPKDRLPGEPDTDVQAALTVLGRTPHPNQRIDLHNTRIRHANLDHVQLDQANLRSADLGEASLAGAHLRRADLGGADLHSANLEAADLHIANLRNADLHAANLRGADLRGADLRVSNLEEAALRSQDLRGAQLGGSNLRRANLADANLAGANLGCLDILRYCADLRGADLRGANLAGADLAGADLREVRGWSAEDIRSVGRTDSGTKF